VTGRRRGVELDDGARARAAERKLDNNSARASEEGESEMGEVR
jgi:hypothetical protein